MLTAIFLIAILVGVMGVLLLAIKILQDTLQKGIQETRTQVKEALTHYSDDLGKRVDSLTANTDMRLKEINHQVENVFPKVLKNH